MTASHPDSDTTEWTDPVIQYLKLVLPRSQIGYWDHMFSSAYQMGVMALVGLGQAEEVQTGAVELPKPGLPTSLPRWDDVCCAVLSLMLQRSEIEYRNFDGTRYEPPRRKGQFVVRPLQEKPVPEPNIAAGFGCGPALAVGHSLELLDVLGLVKAGTWTPEAEFVLWREQPAAWGLSIPQGPRFAAALDACLASLPARSAHEIASLVSITDAQISEYQEKHRASVIELREKYGPKARIGETPDAEMARRTMISTRGNDLNWVFYRGWRIADDWLSDAERGQALDIFHDPLAIQMRKAVVQQLHPNSDVAKAT